VVVSSRARSKSRRQSRSRRRAPSPRASKPRRTLVREYWAVRREARSGKREAANGPAITRRPVSVRPASRFPLPCSPTDPSTLRAH
jgi:hypothetical protein